MRGWSGVWVAAGVAAALTATRLEVQGQSAVQVHLVQVKASNKGEEYVDPTLGRLGPEMKRKYPYRSFRRVESSTQAVGEEAEFALANGMKLTVRLVGREKEMIQLEAVVSEGGREVMNQKLNLRNRATMLISVPWGEDLLLMGLSPRVGEERERGGEEGGAGGAK